MDIDRLQEFLMIAQKHSFKQTAQALNISEAVLSARINTLEKSIGIRLFQRNAHKVELTLKGYNFCRTRLRLSIPTASFTNGSLQSATILTVNCVSRFPGPKCRRSLVLI